jgi:hypothetical protein
MDTNFTNILEGIENAHSFGLIDIDASETKIGLIEDM